MRKGRSTNKTGIGRVEIIQRCLEEEVIPRLMEYPPHRSDKWRQIMRVTINYLCHLAEGNEKWIKARRKKHAVR